MHSLWEHYRMIFIFSHQGAKKNMFMFVCMHFKWMILKKSLMVHTHRNIHIKSNYKLLNTHSHIWGPKVAALVITMTRMVSVSTIDRKDTWWHIWKFLKAA